MGKLPIKLKTFLILIYIVTSLSFIGGIATGNISFDGLASIESIIFFSFLTIITETFTAQFKNMSFSTTFGVTVACFLLLDSISTIIVIIIGFTFRVIKVKDQYKHILNTPWYGTLFNYCVLILPALYAGWIYDLLGGTFNESNITRGLIQTIAFSTTYFFINTFMISLLFSIQMNKKIVYSLISNVRLGILNMIVMTPFGLIIAYVCTKFSYYWVMLLMVPIMLSRYTFSLYITAKNQYIQTVDVLMRAMEARDKYTEGHSQRVSDLSVKIAKELKYNDWKIEDLKIAALLHDVGKIGVDDRILNKPGKLNSDEYNIIKSHPDLGYSILKDVKNLEGIIPIVRNHHERYDGKGYPDGKKGEELNMDVFIVQLADSIDAMATDRPYRKAMSKEQILEEVKTNCGTQFHPRVVEAYLSIIMKEKNSCVR
jgi:putative nucleotidyltransferase with HDIG domain